MTGQRTGAFVETPVDTSKPAKAPDAPVSARDIIGATSTLSRQEFIGAPEQSEFDAYLPVVAELDRRDDRSTMQRLFVPSRYLNPDARVGGGQLNKESVWEDVARYRAADPSFLKDVPAKNADEFAKWVQSKELKQRRQAQDVVGREQGFGQKALGFGAGAVTSLADPINLGAMLLTGPIAGGTKSLLSTVARDAVTNMAIETAELPITTSNRAQFGESTSATDMLGDVAMAGAAGAAFPVAGKLGGMVAKPAAELAGNTVAPAVRATQRTLAPWALSRTGIEKATDAEVASEFAKSVPFEQRTPEAQAGLYVLDREAEVHGASPFVKTPGGLDANAEKLTATTEMLSKPATVGRAPSPVRPQPRATTPLTQDRVINFVLTDLEGGGKLVNLGDGGGLAKYGVTERGNPDVDVANLSQADATRIARQRYWLPEFNRADPRVAAIAFDANYISSPRLARRIIAEAGDDAEKALSIYREHLNHLADSNPEKARFKKGWNNRLDKLARFVGENEAGSVKLAPSAFEGDDVAYRAQMEDLNREELQLADDTPGRADPVRDYVDRLQSGDFPPEKEAFAFESQNRDAIDAEVARREQAGTLGHPDPLAVKASSPIEDAHPTPAQTAMAVREHVSSGGEPTPDAVARDLGIDKSQAADALKAAEIGQGAKPKGANSLERLVNDAEMRGIRLDVSHSRGDVVLSLLDTTTPGRGQGHGTRAMEALVNWADDNGVRLRLSPDASFGATSVGRLTKFYKRFGFKENKGRSRDLSVSDTMLRDPITREQSPVATEPPSTPPSLDPKTYGVDSATDAEAKLLADSVVHDVRALADAGNAAKFEIVEGAPAISAKELVESLDRDQSAIDAIRACL